MAEAPVRAWARAWVRAPTWASARARAWVRAPTWASARARAAARVSVRVWTWASASALLAALVCAPAAQARLEVGVFAHIPAPGYPANALRAADGTIYAGTFHSFSSPSDTGPSKVFAFAPGGTLKRTYTIAGQTPGAAHGAQVAATDRQGILYVLDQDPARILKLDPRTGLQTTWATFASVPACAGPPDGNCTLGSGGNAPEPDFAAWGPDGSLYVTDYNQSLIWRVGPSGGKASVWLTDARFNGVIVGPAGIELMPDRKTLMLSTGGGGTNPSTGKLYTLAIKPSGSPGSLNQLWESAPGDAPDGFALARSGNVYIALVGPVANAVLEISPSGQQLARVPASTFANNMQQVPFDAPGSVTFDGNQVIVANQSAINNDPSHWALLTINVGESGLPLSLPPARPTSKRYSLRIKPHRIHRGRRTKLRFIATVTTSTGRRKPLAGVLISFAGRTARTNKKGRATITVTLTHKGRYRARLTRKRRRLAFITVRVVA